MTGVQTCALPICWSRANLRDWTGTASENLDRLGQEAKALRAEAAEIEKRLSGMGEAAEPLRKLSDLAQVNASRAESQGKLLDTETTFLLEGWVPEEVWPKLKGELDRWPCACEVSDPGPDEYPQVPVKLKTTP